MTRTGPKFELAALERAIRELENRFLRPHLGPPTLAMPARGEILDVAAYVVLVHGALENFVEGLALWVLNRSVANWTNKRRATRCTASLLLYRAAPDDGSSQVSVFDNLRIALDLAKTAHSNAVHENNGVTPRHLRALFLPLGLNVPADPVLTASLDLVVTIRHQWAHQYRYGAKVVKSARDAQVAVGDCLAFAKRLAEEAAGLRP